ncbi:MAG: SDR family NAD(P)-dependent oxidoreductase [Microthrixaceae bacterium]|nr:SDR family NAD(P)-dependent oxidoreductase [Microthrixaceae bacterium]
MVAGNGHLEGRVVVITGAAGGFGRLLANGAAARGAKVVVSDVDQGGVDEVVAALTAEGAEAIGVRTDVTDLAEMKALTSAAAAEFGAVDVMVNNAGTMPLAFIADHEQAAPAWDRCIDINIKGVLHGMIAAHDLMIEQGRGHVVNISSIYGNSATAGAAVYAATKAAVNMMSEAYRIENQGRIKVTIVRPTGVPATGLGDTIVNPQGVAGILGQNMDEYLGVLLGGATAEQQDRDLVEYAALAPEDLVEQILYAIDQPWGVTISDITVRATGDRYLI